MAAIVEDRELAHEVERHRPSQISWGAILAGLVLIMAGSWLLMMLGAAIGIGIVDATDGEVVGNGFGIGTIVWILLTTVVTYFAGSYLAARLNGRSDSAIGLLHGATVWSAGTAAMVLIGYMGLVNVAQFGQAALNQGGSLIGSVVGGGVAGAQRIGASAAAGDIGGSENGASVLNAIAAQVKRQASEAISGRVDGVDAGELREAVADIDAAVLSDVATRLVQGDVDGARAALAEQTALSEQQISNLTDSAAAGIRQALPQDFQNRLQQGGEQLRQRLAERIAEATAGDGNGQVDQQAIDRALADIDPSLLQRVGGQLIQGDTAAARETLAAQTALSSAQVDQLVNDLSNEFRQEIDQLQAQFTQAVDDAQQQMLAATGSAIADMDAQGGPRVTQQEIERALTQLDGDALSGIAQALVQGDVDGAKNQLAIHTTLSEREIDDLVQGVDNAISEQVAELREQVDTAAEAAADYAQAALWLTVLASVIGLAVSLFGGMTGARASEKLVDAH